MSTDANKALTRRFYDAVNARDHAAFDEIFAADLVLQTPFPTGDGAAGIQKLLDQVVEAYPDYQVTVEDQIAEGDQVVTRYTATGTPADGGAAIQLIGIDIDRIADGRIAQHWSEAGPAHLAARRGLVLPRQG